jgi:Cu/Ag efflux protein CusF
MRQMKLAVSVIALAVLAATAALALDGKGEVTKVDDAQGKLTIKHEPIKKFDMDAMTMVFRAADPAMLKSVKPGDKISFDVDKVNGQFTVTKIEKAK